MEKDDFVFVMECVEKNACEDSFEEGEIGKNNCFSMNLTVTDKDFKKCVEKA